ncbi:MAG TPA: hypothetical protein VGB52_00535 [Actinomycetota bacterium]
MLGTAALGLVYGALAAVDALGLVLLYRTTRIVNLAQPAMGLVGGTLVGILVVEGGWSFWWAAPVGIAVGATLGLLTDRIVLRRLEDAPRAVILVATVGLAQIFGAIAVGLAFAVVGGALPTYPLDLGVSAIIDGAFLGGPHILALILLPAAWIGTWWFLQRSRFGLAALALGQEAERARALGVSSATVRAVVWSVAGVLASISGIMIIPVQGFQIGGAFGPVVLLGSLVPAVLAGFRSLHLAVITAIGVQIAYQIALQETSSSVSGLVLALIVIASVALMRRRLGREAAAVRASSWEAAATPRPLPAALARSNRVRLAAVILIVGALVAAAVPPLFLTPSGDVGYALGGAFALAAAGAALAWMFAGEISLGHWGFAAIGGAVAALTPGPWPIRCVVATIATALLGVFLALLSNRRSVLTFAVLSLAAAATAPAAVLRLVGRTVPADAGTVGSVTAVIGVLVALGGVWVRRTRVGARMVAARDDPQRAPWLGANPARERTLALTASTAIAGLAGSLFFAGSLGGLLTTSFEATRSFDLLSLTVIGGLGSSVGAFLGAAAIYAGRIFLPGTWQALLYGVGVIVVVIFMPAGLSRILNRVRDVGARLIAGAQAQPPPVPSHDEAAA